MPIANGKNTPLNQRMGSFPDVSGALSDWFQKMTFGIVTKTVTGFQVVETVEEIFFEGVWQPLREQALFLKPEGQRDWEWFQLHATPVLDLANDSIINYLGVQYRILFRKDYKLNGYIEYHLINDYTGAGPTP